MERRRQLILAISAGLLAATTTVVFVLVALYGKAGETEPASIWVDLNYLSEPSLESEFLLLALPQENAESAVLHACSEEVEVIARVKSLGVRPYRLSYYGWHDPGPAWLFREFGHTKQPRIVYRKGDLTTEVYGYIDGQAFLRGEE